MSLKNIRQVHPYTNYTSLPTNTILVCSYTDKMSLKNTLDKSFHNIRQVY